MSAGKIKKKRFLQWVKVIFVSLLIAFFIRCFIFESFRMPSSQMENAILPGDFICVNKLAYGIKTPAIKEKIPQVCYFCTRSLKRNEIVLYKYNGHVMISRCVGLPGDSLEVKDFDYLINGEKFPQSPNTILSYQYDIRMDTIVYSSIEKLHIPIRNSFVENEQKIRDFSKYEFYTLKENLPDSIVFSRYTKENKPYKIRIPEGQYWMLSDNVNDSADSRHFGFIPHEDLIGKASFIWFSKNPAEDIFHGYRWERIFTKISR